VGLAYSQPAETVDALQTRRHFPLLVTGCGRSGTKYISFALRRMGLDVRHEEMGRDGISSWTMAVSSEQRPFGPPSSAASFQQVFHQTRDPLFVINSCLTFSDSSWDFICDNMPCPRNAPLPTRAAAYWLMWNEKAEQIATWRYRIEDFPDLLLREFMDRLGVRFDRSLINSIPRNFNTRKESRLYHIAEEFLHRMDLGMPKLLQATLAKPRGSSVVTWNVLEELDPRLCTKLRVKAAEYGYHAFDREPLPALAFT
jgi:hypothetical protein